MAKDVKRVKRTKKSAKNEEQEKSLWKVLSGSISLLDNPRKEYGVGETFNADEDEIPKAFRDIVVCLDAKEKKAPAKKKEKEFFIQEIVPTAEEADAEDFVQKYKIVDAKGKVLSEDLTDEEAKEALEKLEE